MPDRAQPMPFADLDGRVLILDKSSRVVRSIPTGPNSFPNGITALPGHGLLVADSVAGTIWQVNAGKGTIRPWLRDDMLLAIEQRPFPGANGIHVAGEYVYGSNTARGLFWRMKIRAGGMPSGVIEKYADIAGPDDFAIAVELEIRLVERKSGC